MNDQQMRISALAKFFPVKISIMYAKPIQTSKKIFYMGFPHKTLFREDSGRNAHGHEFLD